MSDDYGDVPLGVECALPCGYADHTDHGSGRARTSTGKEDGPAPGAARLLWQHRAGAQPCGMAALLRASARLIGA